MKFISDEHGQTVIEYALIVVVLTLVIITAVPGLRNPIIGVFTRFQNQIENP